MFAQLQDSIRQFDIQKGFNKLYLCSPTGTIYSLPSFVNSSWTLDNERVFYIHDCRRLVVEKPSRHIQNALLFAFHGDLRACSKIAKARTFDQLL